jgi:hypothetical protein
LKSAPASDTPFAQMLPSQFVPADEQKGLGADGKVARPAK